VKYFVLCVLAACLIGGCGDESDDARDESGGSSASERETVFDPLTGTLDRARGVENTILDSAEDRRRQIDEQTGVR
jgi:hypothetical protein